MRNLNISLLTIFQLLICLQVLGQGRNEPIGNYFRMGAILTHSNSYNQYEFANTFQTVDIDLILEFTTATTGTFEVEKDSVSISNSINFLSPSRKISLGFSIQSIKQKGTYHELSLVNLSSTQFRITRESIIEHPDFDEPTKRIWNESANIFQFGMRYEFGSFLRVMKANKFNFGLGVFFKPHLNILKPLPVESVISSVTATEFSGNFGIGTTTLFQISKRVFVELKLYPSYEAFNVHRVRLKSPVVSISQRFEKIDSKRKTQLESMLSFKYSIKVPYKKGRSMKF